MHSFTTATFLGSFCCNWARTATNHSFYVKRSFGLTINRKMREISTMCFGKSQYLFYYAHEHVEFRLPELRSLSKMLQIPLIESELIPFESPFLLVTLESESHARTLVQRSVLMKSCFECLMRSKSFPELVKAVEKIPPVLMEPYNQGESSFRIRVHAYGKKLKFEDIRRRIEELQKLPLVGVVDLVNPAHSFHVLEDYGGEGVPRSDKPRQIFFGRWISDGARESVNLYRLDQRYFIGTTSMDPLLALVMANQAMVAPGSLVYDPFVGTGSLLIAAAHFGAYNMGADIDRTLLMGRGRSTRAKKTWRNRDESVLANFKQYSIQSQYLDVLVADATRGVMREDIQFDAIISDPPYGVREAISTVGRTSSPSEDASLDVGPVEIGRCELNDLIIALVSLAAKHLRIGGRLVYWLPALKEQYNETAVPTHECLSLISNSEQHLAGMTSRRLITMEKTKEWKSEYRVTFAMDIYTNTFREKYFTPQRNIHGRQKHTMFKPNHNAETIKDSVRI